jgi:hypothetical protein
VALAGQRREAGGRVERVADGQRLGRRDEARHELVVDRVLDEEPRPGQADLAGVAEDRLDRPVDRVVEVGVLEDEVGALAAELEARPGARCVAAEAMTYLPVATTR